ncbi:MAG TPA: putative LPS assembly protein LptD, partial [Cytophagales bacterium]|nr:putative LPS assembly protein LptD [Cytophagales bacterium]
LQPGILGVKAIRHVMQPSISYNLQPRINKGSAYYNYMFQPHPIDPKLDLPRAGGTNNEFVYGSPSVSAYSEVLNFSIINSIEAKVKDRKDTLETGKDKKIKLIDNITVDGAYSLSADSFNLTNIRVTAVTNLFNRININSSFNFDPYQYSITQRENNTPEAKRIDAYHFKNFSLNNRHLADLRDISVNISTSLNPNWRVKNTYTPQEEALFRMYPYLRYADFSLPWNASISYMFSDHRPVVGPAVTNKVVNVSGNLTFLESWKFNFATSYDLNTTKWGGHQLSVIKDLHCWQMFFTWTPSNAYATYSFKLTAKASTLKGFEPVQKNGSSAF